MHILSLLERRQHKTEEVKYLDQSHFGDGNARTWPGLLVPEPLSSTTLLYYVNMVVRPTLSLPWWNPHFDK